MIDRNYPPSPELEDSEEGEGIGTIEGGTVLVPEGEYVLRYRYYETSKSFDGPKVIVHFAIVELDEYESSPVIRYYNVQRLEGPPRKYGNFVAKSTGDLVREQFALFASEKRLDRISFAALKGKRILASIVAVKEDGHKRPLHPANYYSKVGKLIKILTNEDW